VPSDIVLKTANAVHRALVKVSGGRVGWKAPGMPVLELTTTGRKSGAPRTVMLTSPLQDGDAIVVVASKGGDDDHPAWFLNLRAHPEVEVSIAGAPRRPMRARVATPEERARLWPKVTADHENYAGYQTRTAREIPLVLLEPSRTP
jgi:deazaflavin-dependent oxidoreductase (nitroreductase family)